MPKVSKPKARNPRTVPARQSKNPIDRYRELRQEMVKQRIVVQAGTFSSSEFANVSPEHIQHFENIQVLGRFLYQSYGLQPTPDTVNKPWQRDNKVRAERLSHRARKCKLERLNEGGWRARLEGIIFERFEVEVAWYVVL